MAIVKRICPPTLLDRIRILLLENGPMSQEEIIKSFPLCNPRTIRISLSDDRILSINDDRILAMNNQLFYTDNQ